MKIGISCNSIFNKKGSYKQYDGIGNFTFNLIKEFKKKSTIYLEQVYFDLKGLNHYYVKDLNIQCSPFLFDILPIHWHKSMEKKLCLFHSTDHLIPKLKKTPIIATIHDATLFKEKVVGYKKTWSRKCKHFLLKKHAQYAEHVITGSHFAVPDLVEYWGVKPEKISVIYNGIDPQWFEPISAEFKKYILNKYQLNKKYILSVGTLSPKKNTERLLLAYRALPRTLREEYNLVIVGKKGWDCDDLVRKIKIEQEKGGVKWLNYVALDELRAIYQSASLLVFISLDEGFGLPILEGFASKIPVITSNLSSMPEVAGNAATLLDPTSLESIQTVLQNALEKPNMDLIHMAYNRAKNFSWQKNAEETLNIYKKYL